MWDMNDVVNITYVRGYIFHVEFDDGRSGEVDFSEYAKRGGVFEPLENQSFFRKAIIVAIGYKSCLSMIALGRNRSIFTSSRS
jgi:hypothetical protein